MTTPKTTQLASGMVDIANIALCDIALEKALSRTHLARPGLLLRPVRLPANPFRPPGSPIAAALYYVQAKSVWTRKHTLKSILGEMGIKPAGTIPEMADQIAEELAASAAR